MLLQVPVEGPHAFERSVHALAMERHDGVGRIADDHGSALVAPAVGSHGAERTGGVGRELLGEVGDEFDEPVEVFGEEAGHARCVFQCGERRLRREQCHREVALGVGERDEHEFAPRPDVECVRVELNATRRRPAAA